MKETDGLVTSSGSGESHSSMPKLLFAGFLVKKLVAMPICPARHDGYH